MSCCIGVGLSFLILFVETNFTSLRAPVETSIDSEDKFQSEIDGEVNSRYSRQNEPYSYSGMNKQIQIIVGAAKTKPVMNAKIAVIKIITDLNFVTINRVTHLFMSYLYTRAVRRTESIPVCGCKSSEYIHNTYAFLFISVYVRTTPPHRAT